jgi:hypothetical protein
VNDVLQLVARLAQRAENGPFLLQHDVLSNVLHLARLVSLQLQTLHSDDADYAARWRLAAPTLAVCIAAVRGMCRRPPARRVETFAVAACVVGCDAPAPASVRRLADDNEVCVCTRARASARDVVVIQDVCIDVCRMIARTSITLGQYALC